MKPADPRRNGLIIIILRVVGAGLALLAQIIASRIVGADEFGRYSLLLVWLLLLGHGSTFGTNPLLSRFIAGYLKTGDLPAIAGLLRFSLLIVGLASLAASILAIGLIHTDWLGLDHSMVVLGTLAFSAVPLLALQDFLESIARGLDKPTLGIAPAYLVRHLAIITGVGGLFLLGFDTDAVTIMGMTILGLVLSLAIQYSLIRRHLRPLIKGRKSVYRTGEWRRTVLPMAASDAAEVLFMNADIMILGMFVAPELVAYYFAATRFAQILAYVPYGMSAATAQRMAALAGAHERDLLQRLITQTTIVSGGLTTIGALLMVVLAGPLMSLFGASYSEAAHLIPVLCAGIALACLLGPGEDVLNMLGQERAASVSIIVALCLNIGLNFVLIPSFGPTGAAVASATALAARGILMAFFARRRLGLSLVIFSDLRFKARGEQAT